MTGDDRAEAGSAAGGDGLDATCGLDQRGAVGIGVAGDNAGAGILECDIGDTGMRDRLRKRNRRQRGDGSLCVRAHPLDGDQGECGRDE
ncbi:MAG: hypothetical protein AUG10_01085 [Gemmatimonadetes bacterium 13_1_20CM_2_70_10]|nr:MAG: hypothetical protein AUG10_01085 [Gemmatimonadetes bacterium 13_1_20CM_2_70_10]